MGTDPIPPTPPETYMKIKYNGVEVDRVVPGRSINVEFAGSQIGTYKLYIFGSDGYVKHSDTQYGIQSGTFTWVPTDVTVKQYPIIKGPGIFKYRSVKITD